LLLLKQYFYIIQIGKTELSAVKLTIPANLMFLSIGPHKDDGRMTKYQFFSLLKNMKVHELKFKGKFF